MAIDASFKYYFKEATEDVLEIAEDIKVGKLPLEIDLIVRITDMSRISSIGFYPIFKVYQLDGRNIIIVEYKSGSDRLEYRDLSKIHAYRYLYMYKTDYDIDDTFPLLIITQPQNTVFEKVNKKQIDPGIYQLEYETRIYLIVINELEVLEKNLGLLYYSTGKKEKEFLRKIIQMNTKNTKPQFVEKLLYLSFVNKYEEMIELAQAEKFELDRIKRNRKLAIEALGKSELLQEIGTEEVLREIGTEEVLREIGTEEVLKEIGTEEIVKNLSEEDKKRLRKLLE